MALTDSQIKTAYAFLAEIDDLEQFKVTIADLDLSLKFSEVIALLEHKSINGTAAVNEFKQRVTNLITVRQNDIRRNEIDPLGIIEE